MSLLFRMVFTIFSSFFRKPLKELEESVLTLRIWPNDLDINLHMNNGRYLTLMDLGRLDLISRAGLLKVMLRRRWSALR